MALTAAGRTQGSGQPWYGPGVAAPPTWDDLFQFNPSYGLFGLRPGITPQQAAAAGLGAGFGGGGQGGFGGGGQGSFGDLLARLLAEQENRWEEARAANESRYGDILSRYDQRQQEALELLGQTGKQEIADIERIFTERGKATTQDMVSRGLSDSTVLPTLQTAIEREKTGAMTRARESQALQRAAFLSGLSGEQLGFMERREDTYPSEQTFLALLQMLSEQQSAGPFGPWKVG